MSARPGIPTDWDAAAPRSAAVAGARSVVSGLRWRVLLPLAIALLLLIATFVSIFLLDASRRQSEAIAHTASAVTAMSAQQAADGGALMHSLMELVMRDERLAAALRAGDRRTLLDLSAPILQEIKARNLITHFQYILPDSTVLLRVQAPDKYGDKISRFVLEEAQRTGQPYAGSEKGSLGSYTLRAVHPWRSNGELIGFVEMGIEFEDLMRNIKRSLVADVFVAIDKTHFERAKWDENQRRKERPIAWDEFPSVVVLSRTSAIPPPVAAHLAGLNGSHAHHTFESGWDDHVAQTIVLPLRDLRGSEIGELVVLHPITAGVAERNRTAIGVIALGVALGGSLMAFFFILLGRVERDVAARTANLNRAQQVLATEQIERQRAERELASQQERNALLEEQARMAQEQVLTKKALEDRSAALAKSLALLSATLESTADGIIATRHTDAAELVYNNQYATMWGVPAELLTRGISSELVAFVATQVKDPEDFVARANLTRTRREAETFNVLELKDGRTFERHVKPQRIGGEVVGVVINFRDITERRRIETELQVAQRELLAKARQAGMAEIATNGLHTVGTVLTSVNISAGMVARTVRESRAAGLARVVSLFDEHAADLGDFLTHDAKGKLLPLYMSRLARALAAEQQSMLDELDSLARSVDHIKEIVATQQSYAGNTAMLEPVQVADLVEDALRMNTGALASRQVTVVREIAELPALQLDRHRLLLILINLIGNAKNALDGSAGETQRVTVRAQMARAGVLGISVADTGEGIAPENLARVFLHGFTTRKNGHGFGLHSCVLAAQEMGGSLTADSDGRGRGACFTLEIPIAAADGMR